MTIRSNRWILRMTVALILAGLFVYASVTALDLRQRNRTRQIVQRAEETLNEGDYREASELIGLALKRNPDGVEQVALMTRLMEEIGSPRVVEWREQLAELDPDNPQRSYDWALASLRTGDLPGARRALSRIPDSLKGTSGYFVLKGGLALRDNKPDEAEGFYGKALEADPSNRVAALNRATLLARSDSPERRDAGLRLLSQMTEDPQLGFYAQRQLRSHFFNRGEVDKALEVSLGVLESTNARVSDRIVHLEILGVANEDSADQYRLQLRSAATTSPKLAFALGKKVSSEEGWFEAFQWLSQLPEETRQAAPTSYLYADCLVLREDWQGLVSFLEKVDWGGRRFFKFALTARAFDSIGREREALRAWNLALESSRDNRSRLDDLLRVCDAFDWEARAAEVLELQIEAAPQEMWAVNGLRNYLYSKKDTPGIQRLCRKVFELDENNPRAMNDLGYACLLLEADLEFAHALAKRAYKLDPNNPSAVATFALSLFKQQQFEQALEVVGELGEEALNRPSIAACAGAIHAACGDLAVAKKLFARIKPDHSQLLPEEILIIQRAEQFL